MSPVDISLSMLALVHVHTSSVTTFQLGQGWESDYSHFSATVQQQKK